MNEVAEALIALGPVLVTLMKQVEARQERH